MSKIKELLEQASAEQKGWGYLIPMQVDQIALVVEYEAVREKLTFAQFMGSKGFVLMYYGGLSSEEKDAEFARIMEDSNPVMLDNVDK